MLSAPHFTKTEWIAVASAIASNVISLFVGIPGILAYLDNKKPKKDSYEVQMVDFNETLTHEGSKENSSFFISRQGTVSVKNTSDRPIYIRVQLYRGQISFGGVQANFHRFALEPYRYVEFTVRESHQLPMVVNQAFQNIFRKDEDINARLKLENIDIWGNPKPNGTTSFAHCVPLDSGTPNLFSKYDERFIKFDISTDNSTQQNCRIGRVPELMG